MRVGIITYHRAHNYGAVLQCYALQEVLKELGHEVRIIDYRQPFIERLYNPSKVDQIIKQIFHPRNLIGLKRKFESQDFQSTKFKEFRIKYLNETAPCDSNSVPEFDCYIVGSDQMWSIDCVGNHIDPIYFGLFTRPNNSKVIGFSISSNQSSVNELQHKLISFCKNFDNLSFREASIAESINRFTSSNFQVTLDPTLCSDHHIWNKLINSEWTSRKYIVLYHVKLRFSPIIHKMMLAQAHRLAKAHGIEVVDLSDGKYSVNDFVSAIKYAQFVLTSSFHATVFSLIFNRPLFCVRLHDGHDDRYVDLLKNLDAYNYLVDLDFTDTVPADNDYNMINSNLEKLREPSIEYLRSNIC